MHTGRMAVEMHMKNERMEEKKLYFPNAVDMLHMSVVSIRKCTEAFVAVPVYYGNLLL
jgi:hypothetical protein